MCLDDYIVKIWLPGPWGNLTKLWDWQEAYLAIKKIYIHLRRIEKEILKEKKSLFLYFSTRRIKPLILNLNLFLYYLYAKGQELWCVCECMSANAHVHAHTHLWVHAAKTKPHVAPPYPPLQCSLSSPTFPLLPTKLPPHPKWLWTAL